MLFSVIINAMFRIHMGHLHERLSAAMTVMVSVVCLAGCAAGSTTSSAGLSADTSDMHAERDNTPRVLSPRADGTDTEGTDSVTLDFSNKNDGYFAVSFHGDSDKVKLQITTEDSIVYTYNVPADGTTQFFPFSDGDGSYGIGIYTNIKDTLYATEYETSVDVTLDNSYSPFLYPNQYVWFTDTTKAVAKSAEIVQPADTDLDAVTLVYDFVVNNITYDWDEAENVQSGYIPDVDEVLETGKGICFDYSSLMAAMLRSQRIPARMEIGYVGSTYHAWLSTYIDEIGWVNGIIRFDGTDWSLMDPTLASTEGESGTKNYITDSSQYRTCYLY